MVTAVREPNKKWFLKVASRIRDEIAAAGFSL